MKRMVWLGILAVGLAYGEAARPELYATFSFQIYRSGSRGAGFGNLRGGGFAGPVDLYAAVTSRATGETWYAAPDGRLGTVPVVFRRQVVWRKDQQVLGYLCQPVFATGQAHLVDWWLMAVPSGTAVASSAELGRKNLAVSRPTPLHIASQPFSQPWERFAFLRAYLVESGIQAYAEVQDGGRRFACYAGPDAAERLWQLPGPKLILVAGLGCSGRSWVGDFEKFAAEGWVDPARHDLLSYSPLLRQYRYVAFFEYRSAGALDGPEILGRLAETMRGARPEDRIDMIGHSMGGMVVRSFVELAGGHRVVDHAVLMQTPLNGVNPAPYQGLASLLPAPALAEALESVSPLSKMLAGSSFYQKLNGPWERGEPPTSATGYGNCRYFCVAAGVYGSGRDPRRTDTWYDRQSDAMPTDITARSALWLPLGGGKPGELDPSGWHELLLIADSPEHDRFIEHVSFVFHMGNDQRNGSARWLLSRLWPEAKR